MTNADTTSQNGANADRRWLDERHHEFKQQHARSEIRESRWSWARLLTFVAAVAPWLFLGQHPLWAVGISLALGILFVFTVCTHLALQAEREAADRLLLVTDEALRRCGGSVACLRTWERPGDAPDIDQELPRLFESGETWPLTSQERDDLDLFAAPVGVFGLLNRASTALGMRRLRDLLERPLLNPDRILARQAMVRWLAEHGRARLTLMAALAVLRNEDARLGNLVRAIAGLTPLVLRVPYWLLVAWSVLSAGFAVFGLARTAASDPLGLFWLLSLIAFNALVLRRMQPELTRGLKPWQDVGWAVRGALTAARQAVHDLPAETELASLRESFHRAARPDALRQLRRRAAWSEAGGLLHAALNVTVLYDIHVARAIERCVTERREDLLRGLSAVAELDALCGVASCAWEQPISCWPIPTDETGVTILGGVHPLVAPDRVVANDVRLAPDVRTWVITGSNMAGKSTYLRMVGVNVLLAQVGAAALAHTMRWSPLRLVTDLRVRDNLAEDESYFLAEVRHLRRMIQPSEERTPLLGLIDEPFRGTNSQEQSAASVAVLQHLVQSPHLFVVATHDRHLTALPDGSAARNFHFREDLSQEGMVFDYRLHEGPAQTRNALRILEREGYPPALVARAYEWLGETPA